MSSKTTTTTSQPKKEKKRRNKKGKNKTRNGDVMTINLQTAPAAVSAVAKTLAPKWKPMKGGKVCVSHLELIGTLNGSDDFTVQTFPLNPGLTQVFLWLSSIAQNYESYNFKQLRFVYAGAASSTTPGTVYLAIDFDPADPPPQTEQQLAVYFDCVSGAPWTKKLVYNATKSNMSKQKTYLIRNSNDPTPSNLPTYDTGNLIVGTEGNGLTTAIGKLWIEYEVEFQTPQGVITGPGRSLSGKYTGTDGTTNPAFSGNAPIDVTAAGGIITITSRQSYQALVDFTAGGSTITGVTTTGAQLVQKTSVINAGTTGILVNYTLAFTAPKQVVTLDLQSATMTSYAMRVGQYNVTVNA